MGEIGVSDDGLDSSNNAISKTSADKTPAQKTDASPVDQKETPHPIQQLFQDAQDGKLDPPILTPEEQKKHRDETIKMFQGSVEYLEWKKQKGTANRSDLERLAALKKSLADMTE